MSPCRPAPRVSTTCLNHVHLSMRSPWPFRARISYVINISGSAHSRQHTQTNSHTYTQDAFLHTCLYETSHTYIHGIHMLTCHARVSICTVPAVPAGGAAPGVAAPGKYAPPPWSIQPVQHAGTCMLVFFCVCVFVCVCVCVLLHIGSMRIYVSVCMCLDMCVCVYSHYVIARVFVRIQLHVYLYAYTHTYV
jgi:hypothetical protein